MDQVTPGGRALGIDVGLRKGLDLVLLDGGRQVEAVAPSLSHNRLREVVLEWAPDVVAIDSPPDWAPPEGMRETEQAMRRLGIQLYVTPACEKRSAKGFHDWMVAGMEAFQAIGDLYPLFTGGSPSGCAMEVFPHAAAVVLAGGLMPSGLRKRDWRRRVLATAGVADPGLRTADLIDAALAALTGLYAIEGAACWRGRPEQGVIVLPCTHDRLPERYARLATGGA